MIAVTYMKPFYTRVSNGKLRMVFIHQYISIVKDEEVYDFIPIEGKDIIIDLDKGSVENLGTIFTFRSKSGNIMRISLYHLMLIPNVYDFLNPIIEANIRLRRNADKKKSDSPTVAKFICTKKDIEQLFNDLERFNISNAIDTALENNDEELFYELSKKLISIQNTIS